jgi:hypothetical protein
MKCLGLFPYVGEGVVFGARQSELIVYVRCVEFLGVLIEHFGEGVVYLQSQKCVCVSIALLLRKPSKPNVSMKKVCEMAGSP